MSLESKRIFKINNRYNLKELTTPQLKLLKRTLLNWLKISLNK